MLILGVGCLCWFQVLVLSVLFLYWVYVRRFCASVLYGLYVVVFCVGCLRSFCPLCSVLVVCVGFRCLLPVLVFGVDVT